MIDLAEEERKSIWHAMIVGLRSVEESESIAKEHVAELASLTANLSGVEVLPESMTVTVAEPMIQYYVGTGKAHEICDRARELGADCIVFDAQLSPSQQRNWERLSKLCVIDREEVILDIFAERASTREAVLQIELARAEYSLPRLTRAWTHLSRQHGGGATNRGEGETQIENDRRTVKRRIQQMREELKKVRRQRDTERKNRSRGAVLHGAIVGYTNVGKSSLLKALSGADVLVRDQLFATLDPTTRKVPLGNHQEILLTDTVGFVRNLPHTLVEAFKSTLEEAVLADFLLLVLDVSSPHLDEQWETTLSVLKELGAEEKDITVVFNKFDRVDPERDAVLLSRLRGLFPGAFYISANERTGLEKLQEHLSSIAQSRSRVLKAVLPPEQSALAAFAHAKGQIYEEEYDENGCLHLTFSIDERYQHNFKEYCL